MPLDAVPLEPEVSDVTSVLDGVAVPDRGALVSLSEAEAVPLVGDTAVPLEIEGLLLGVIVTPEEAGTLPVDGPELVVCTLLLAGLLDALEALEDAGDDEVPLPELTTAELELTEPVELLAPGVDELGTYPYGGKGYVGMLKVEIVLEEAGPDDELSDVPDGLDDEGLADVPDGVTEPLAEVPDGVDEGLAEVPDGVDDDAPDEAGRVLLEPLTGPTRVLEVAEAVEDGTIPVLDPDGTGAEEADPVEPDGTGVEEPDPDGTGVDEPEPPVELASEPLDALAVTVTVIVPVRGRPLKETSNDDENETLGEDSEPVTEDDGLLAVTGPEDAPLFWPGVEV